MDNNLLISIIAMIGSFFGVICGIINHKRLRSKCLSEKELILSLDVEDTTPQKKEDKKEDLKIKLPPKIPNSPKSEEIEDVKIN